MPRSTASKTKPVSQAVEFSYSFEAIGTAWKVEVFDTVSPARQTTVSKAIRQLIAAFDKHYSRFRADSLVSAMAQNAGTYQLPADAQPLMDLYVSLYKSTGGAVTPLIGQTLADAGYDATYSLQPKSAALTAPPNWEEALNYEFPHLTVKQPVLLDFGAAGKGYLVDLIGDALQQHDIQSFCVDGSGDLLYRSARNQTLDIALEHPKDPSMAIGVARIHNQSLCGSSGNRRAWGPFHHIIDPHKLSSPKDILAVWTTAHTALLADGLATALFFVPAKQLQTSYTFEYALVRQDYSLEHSAQFPADFFTNRNATHNR